jgi:hypothetical protein
MAPTRIKVTPTKTNNTNQNSNGKKLSELSVDQCIDSLLQDGDIAQRLRNAINEEMAQNNASSQRQYLTPNPMVLSLLNCMRHLIIELEPRFESNLESLHCGMTDVQLGRLCETYMDHYTHCADTLRYRDALCKHLPHRKVSQTKNGNHVNHDHDHHQCNSEHFHHPNPPFPIHHHFQQAL